MAEREFEFGKVIPASEAEQEYIFDPEIRDLLASGDAIQGFPTSMVSERVGLPTALARGAADLFDTSRREVIMPAARELGESIEAYNPETFGFDERIEERLRPGVFLRPEEATSGPEARANMPLARGFSQAVDFAGDLATSPETRAETARAIQEFPDIFARQMKISGEAGLRGERVIDPETGMEGSPFDPLLTATAGLGVARVAGGIPDGGPALGIFGGKNAANRRQNFEEFDRLTRDQKFPLELASQRTKVFIGADNQLKTNLGFLRVSDGLGSYKEGKFAFLSPFVFSRNENDQKEARLIDIAPLQVPETTFNNKAIYEAYPELENFIVRLEERTSQDDAPRYDANLQRLILPGTSAKELQIAVQDYIGKKEGFARPIDPEIYRASIQQNLQTLPLTFGRANNLRQFAGFRDPLETKNRQTILERPEEDILRFGPPTYSRIEGSFGGRDLSVPGTLLPRIGAEADLGPDVFDALTDPRLQGVGGHLRESLDFHLTGPNALGIMSGRTTDELPVLSLDEQKAFFRQNPFFQEQEDGPFLLNQEAINELQYNLQRKNEFRGKNAKDLANMAERGTFGSAYAKNIRNFKDELNKIMPPDEKVATGPFSYLLGLLREGTSEEDASRPTSGPDTQDEISQRRKDVLNKLQVAADYYENLSREDQARLVSGGADRYLSEGILQVQERFVDPARFDDFFLEYDKAGTGIPGILDIRKKLFEERESLSIPAPVNPVFDQLRDTAGANLPVFTNFNRPLPKIKRLLGNLPRTRGTPQQFIADLKKAGATPADLDNLNLERYFQESATDGKINRDSALLAFDLADRQLVFDVDRKNTYQGVSLPIDDDDKIEVVTVHSPIRAGDVYYFNEQHRFANPVQDQAGVPKGNALLIVNNNMFTRPTKPNMLGHVRATTHDDPETGEKTYVVNELQSDFARYLDKLPPAIVEAGEERAALLGLPPQEAVEQVRAEIYATPFAAERPHKFMRRIQQQLLERSLRRAVELDADHFATVTGDMSGFIQNRKNKNYKPQYNEKIVSELKKLAKKYDLEFAPALGGKSLPIFVSRDGGRNFYDSLDQALQEERDDMFDFNAMESDVVDAEDGMYITVNSLKLTPEAKERISAEPFEFSKGGAVQSYANGGMVNNMRRRNISGLTNLFSKYNTSGPLAGAGVPRGTMPVEMRRGGRARSPREEAYRTDAPNALQRPAVLTEPTTLEELQAILPPPSTAADLNISDGRADELGAFDQPTPDPVISAPTAAPVVSAPFTPSTGIVAGGPAPGEVEVTREDDGIILEGRIPQPDPLPPLPPPPPPVVDVVPPPPPPVVDVVQPPSAPVTPPPMLPPAPDLPPPVYQPPQPTEVTVPTEPMFTPPPVAATPQLPDPVMLSGETVDFDIADEITPQTGGYATTQGMNIAATGDPFADAVEGQYQMPIYRPTVAAGAMPFLSLNFARPSTPSDPPPPPQSENYSTGSYGRLEFAEALANYERMYGPVEDYQAPDTDAVMTDDTTQSTDTATGTGASTVTSGTRFYPEPPPTPSGRGGIGNTMRFNRQKKEWEDKYGPVEGYYAAQEAARNEGINAYLSRQGEEAIAAQYGMTVEQLRDVNARRRQQGLGPLGELASGINVGM